MPSTRTTSPASRRIHDHSRLQTRMPSVRGAGMKFQSSQTREAASRAPQRLRRLQQLHPQLEQRQLEILYIKLLQQLELDLPTKFRPDRSFPTCPSTRHSLPTARRKLLANSNRRRWPRIETLQHLLAKWKSPLMICRTSSPPSVT